VNRHQRRAAAAGERRGDEHLAITRRDQLEAACAAMTAMQAPQLPLFRAAADGVIGLAFVTEPATPWPSELLASFRKPALVVLHDDLAPERASSPPGDWRCAAEMRAWALSAIVHGAAAEADHYRIAIVTTLLVGRAAIVETSSAFVAAWCEFLKPLPVLAIVPRGGLHPVPPRPEDMH